MSAYNCGCDPEAKWTCRDSPDCAGARAERERKIELIELLMKNGLEAIRARELEGVVPVREVIGVNGIISPAEMTLNDYQRSLHAYKDRHQECHALGLSGELAEVFGELTAMRDAAIAAGNVADMVKKATAHGVPLDPAKLKKELGDVLWYITAVAGDNALTLEDIAKANVAKLQERYPNGFVKGGGVHDPTTYEEIRAAGVVGEINAGIPAAAEARHRANAVHFGCGCSETVIDDITYRSLCANGNCRRMKR